MIKNIFLAFENRINNLSWMSETKVSALAKLNKSRIKLGILTSGKTILLDNQSPEGGSYFTNALSMAKWRFEENIAD
jgi:predicted metalloendopeptidase